MGLEKEAVVVEQGGFCTQRTAGCLRSLKVIPTSRPLPSLSSRLGRKLGGQLFLNPVSVKHPQNLQKKNEKGKGGEKKI